MSKNEIKVNRDDITTKKCDQCQIEEGKYHPIYNFEVTLEQINWNGLDMLACQECRLRIQVNKLKAKDSSAEGRLARYLKSLEIVRKVTSSFFKGF